MVVLAISQYVKSWWLPGRTNNDDHTLGRVGNRLSDGVGLLDGHGGQLVVRVEYKP